MKTVRLLLFLFSFAGLFGACKKEEAQPQAPLIANGDIEQQFAGWLFSYDGQHPSNPNGYAYGFTAEAASSPTYSLKLNCNQVKNDTAFSYYGQQKITTTNIPVGAKLTLKARIKTVDIKGKGLSLAIRGDKVDQPVFFVSTEGKTLINGTKDFTEYTVTLDSYPGGIDNLLIFLLYLPQTTGAVYFDDISLTVN